MEISFFIQHVSLELRLSGLLAGTITLLSHLPTPVTMTFYKDRILTMDEPSFFLLLVEDKPSFSFYPPPSSILWNPYYCVPLPRNEEAKLLPGSSSGEFAEFPEVVAIESQSTIAKPGSISGALL